MVEKQISKIITMATMTELVGEPAMGTHDSNEHSLSEEYNSNLIRTSIRLRYERDPSFHSSMQKLIKNVLKRAEQESRPFEEVFDEELGSYQENHTQPETEILRPDLDDEEP